MKSLNQKSIIVLLISLLLTFNLYAIDGKAIMEKVDKISREASRSI
jgi:hypothetical protein